MIKSHLLILFCFLASIEISVQDFVRKSIFRRQNAKIVLFAIPNENSAILNGFMGPLEKLSNLTVLGTRRAAYSKKTSVLSRGPVNKIDFLGDLDEPDEPDDSDKDKFSGVFTRTLNRNKPVDSKRNSNAANDARLSSNLYSFSYSSKTHDGSLSTRKEKADKNGKVTGFYMLMYPDGTKRRVDYVADSTGFHAKIRTNEIGVGYQNPADVKIERYPVDAKIEKNSNYSKNQRNQRNPKSKVENRDSLGKSRKANFARSSVSTGSINKSDDEDYAD